MTHAFPKDLTVPSLCQLVIKKAADYVRTIRDYDKDTASLIAEEEILSEACGSNYGGLSALAVLVHQLHFRAVLYDEIGGHCQLVRPADVNLPLISISHIYLVSSTKPSIPLFSHPASTAPRRAG